MRPTLDQIACRTGTDKSSLATLPAPPDHFASRPSHGHGYTFVYDDYLGARRDAPLHVLEIGVLDGRSLAMWQEYFPAATIIGFDLDPACQRFATDRVRIITGNQGNPADLDRVIAASPGGFDLIIDDGSHYAAHVMATFGQLFPHLVPGGFYVIEDLGTAADPRWGRVAYNRGMAMQSAPPNDPHAFVAFLEGIRARPDVAEFSLFLNALGIIRKAVIGDATVYPPRGGEIRALLPPARPPLWRRALNRVRR